MRKKPPAKEAQKVAKDKPAKATYHDIQQHTVEWDVLRLGRFGASTARELFAGRTTDSYHKLIYRVAYERMTGEAPEMFQNAYMNRGVELEAQARDVYELQTFSKVTNGGYYSFNEWIGCSPDGLVGKDGMIQIKCPAFNTHIDYLLGGVCPKEYYAQIQFELMVSGRKWSDFMSYHPHLRPFIVRVERDPKLMEAIQAQLRDAVDEVLKLIKALEP